MKQRKINDPWEITQDRPPTSLDGAVVFLKNWLSQKTNEDTGRPMIEVVTEMINENPTEWWLGYHFGWGMGMRNLLRENGYGEQELGIGNLDDHYIALIEQACLGMGNHHHKMLSPDADDTSSK